MKKLIILGKGGHAQVVRDLCRLLGYVDFAYILAQDEDEFLRTADPSDFVMALGMGMPAKDSIKGLQRRFDVASKFVARGFTFPALIHPSAVVATSANVASGAQIMAGAVVQSQSQIRHFAIVNTRASVDHDCTIGEGAHVAPGVTLGGSVNIGNFGLVGIGATVLPNLLIGPKALIAGGSVVIHHVLSGEVVMGVPATPTMLLPSPMRPWTGRTPFSDPMPEHGLPGDL